MTVGSGLSMVARDRPGLPQETPQAGRIGPAFRPPLFPVVASLALCTPGCYNGTGGGYPATAKIERRDLLPQVSSLFSVLDWPHLPPCTMRHIHGSCCHRPVETTNPIAARRNRAEHADSGAPIGSRESSVPHNSLFRHAVITRMGALAIDTQTSENRGLQ